MPVENDPTAYDALTVGEEGAVLFAEITSPPMKSPGPRTGP